MIASLRSEFRKMLSVRSTYIVIALSLLLLVFFAFYIEGIRANPEAANDPHRLASEVTQAVTATAVLVSLVGLLLFTHEYRYNTIMYTLTSSKSRTQVLFAKILTVTCFALLLTLVIGILSPIYTYLGMSIKGYELVPQIIPVKDLLLHCLFYGWGFSMAALLFAALIRSQVGAIVAIFLIPGSLEALLGLLLKKNQIYLPFSALNQVLQQSSPEAGGGSAPMTAQKAALVFSAYLIVGWIVAFILFLRRDAN